LINIIAFFYNQIHEINRQFIITLKDNVLKLANAYKTAESADCREK
jgi:hypothetical protein